MKPTLSFENEAKATESRVLFQKNTLRFRQMERRTWRVTDD
jgi:hypothetical protein